MAGLFEKAFLRALNEDSFADMVRDGKAPVSEEEVDELLELEILEPTEPDVWEMYHRGLIDKEKRDSLLSPFKHKRQMKKQERVRKQKQVQKWQGMRQNQIDMELARNAEPDEWQAV